MSQQQHQKEEQQSDGVTTEDNRDSGDITKQIKRPAGYAPLSPKLYRVSMPRWIKSINFGLKRKVVSRQRRYNDRTLQHSDRLEG
ncbi:hypothetical protein INR49_003408 [Caranx melampygus]|nr:hypothetical protein INR49_003408 [Caranx melampygus]